MFLPTLKQPEQEGRARRRRAAAKVYNAGQGLASWATIVAVVVALVSFYYGYSQFRETQEATRQTLTLQRRTLELETHSLELDRDNKAVELMVKYNDLMREAYSSSGSHKVAVEFWRDNSGVAIAESIFKLRGDDEGWRATVRWMLGNHKAFLKNGLDCLTYDAEFIQVANSVVKCDVCADPVRCWS